MSTPRAIRFSPDEELSPDVAAHQNELDRLRAQVRQLEFDLCISQARCGRLGEQLATIETSGRNIWRTTPSTTANYFFPVTYVIPDGGYEDE